MQKLIELIKRPDNFIQIFRDKTQDSFAQLLNNMIIQLLYGQCYLKSKQYTIIPVNYYKLPEFPKNKIGTLFLDLDETLMTTFVNKNKAQYQINIRNKEICEQDQISKNFTIKFSIRPFAKEMLLILHCFFEIFIFTASQIEYAQEVAKILDPENQYINGIFDRQYCYKTEDGIIIKDLRIFQNRNIDNILLIDNLSFSFGFQSENGILVSSWLGNPDDKELTMLTIYLLELSQYKNLRKANSEHLSYNQILSLYSKLLS